MSGPVVTAGVGLVAGVLSGAFGVGGGIVTTPAIRLVLGYPELVAVGTPLLVIIPTAVVGTMSYARRDLVDVPTALSLGGWGAAATVVGAWGSSLAGGTAVLLATAVLIAYVGAEMLRDALFPRHTAPLVSERHPRCRSGLMALGISAGLYSGFLGLGGGLVIVPALMRIFGFPVKRAIGTSLMAVALLALPGAASHSYLGHVDVSLGLALAVGVVPGVLVGARLTVAARDRVVQAGFGVLLACTAAWLAINESGVLG